MTNNSALGRKTVLAVSIIMLVGIFAASVGYRMTNPGLEKHVKQEGHGGGGGGGMPPAMGGEGMPGGMAGLKDKMALLEKDPENFEALRELGNAFMMMRAWERAAPFLERASKVRPEDPEIRMSLGIVRFQQKDYPAAAAIYENLLEEAPEDPLVNYNLGILYTHFLNKPEAAVQRFEKVIENAGDDKEMLERAREEMKHLDH
ncbi:tetratricopeptide repeat protein [Salidesulfovibrio brasiliensis]